jgi:uncharacterized protein YcbK (DUF882 family)
MKGHWTRRSYLKTLVASGAGITLGDFAFAAEDAAPVERSLELYNTHTRETVSVVFQRGEEYVASAIAALRNVLRDHRNGEAHDIDLELYDQLHDLAAAAGREPRFEIISGYRSPESNAKLAAAGNGVSEKSLHMSGRAIDMRLRNYLCADLRDLALAAKRGGVGYYERSNFVHIDTGRFRTWVG